MQRRKFLLLPGLALQAQVPSRAGFAEADITPPIGSEKPGNYFKMYSKAIHDPLKVRAAYFETAGAGALLIGLDTLMVPRSVVEAARKRLPQVPVMIGASHTHSAGPVGMVQPGEYDHAPAEVQDLAYRQTSAADPKYLKLLEDQIVAAALAAQRNSKATLWGYGSGSEGSIAFNRRFRMKNGLTYTHPRQGNPDILEPAGPVDPIVTVLGVFNESKQLTGCVVNYSCHATTDPPGISANWIYYMERAIRGHFGNGVNVVFLQGFSGDVTQVDNLDLNENPTGDEYARLVGGKVGAEAVKILLAMKPGPGLPVQAVGQTYHESRRYPSPERLARSKEIAARGRDGAPLAEWAFAKEVVLLDALLVKWPTALVELQAIAIGPAVYVSAPGEMFVELGLEIRKGSPFRYTNPVSLANGCVGYVPTAEALSAKGGGYEQRLTSYTNLVPEAGARMVRRSIALMKQLKPVEAPKGPPAPAFRAPWDYGNHGPENDALSPDKVISLFNGRDLSSFYIWLKGSRYEDPKGVFTVANGQIRISGEDWGGITTKQMYRDYRLVVEWRWGSKTWAERETKARDSGILLHGFGKDGGYNGIWLESIESQIIEGGSGDILVVSAQTPMSASCICSMKGKEMYWDVKGTKMTREKGRIDWYARAENWKDEINFRGAADVERRLGQWNRQEVICAGDSIVNVVNGKVVSAAFDLSHTQGKIQIQSEGAEMFVRRVELHPLDAAARILVRGSLPESY